MDTYLINGEEYVRVEPNKFVKRSALAKDVKAEAPKEPKDVNAEAPKEPKDVKTDVKAEDVKDVKTEVKAEDVKAAEAPKDVKTDVKTDVKAAEEPKDVKADVKADVTVVDPWIVLRSLPDLKDVSEERLKLAWDELFTTMPLVGFLDQLREVKTIVRDVEVFFSEQAFDFLGEHETRSDMASFEASNGFRLYGGVNRWADEINIRSEKLFMSANTFRGKRANLTTIFARTKIEDEWIAKLKVALTEFSDKAKQSNIVPKLVTKNLSEMQSL